MHNNEPWLLLQKTNNGDVQTLQHKLNFEPGHDWVRGATYTNFHNYSVFLLVKYTLIVTQNLTWVITINRINTFDRAYYRLDRS